jgi:hypothetical protein
MHDCPALKSCRRGCLLAPTLTGTNGKSPIGLSWGLYSSVWQPMGSEKALKNPRTHQSCQSSGCAEVMMVSRPRRHSASRAARTVGLMKSWSPSQPSVVGHRFCCSRFPGCQRQPPLTCSRPACSSPLDHTGLLGRSRRRHTPARILDSLSDRRSLFRHSRRPTKPSKKVSSIASRADAASWCLLGRHWL